MRRRPCGRQCCAPLTPPFTADSVVRQVVTQICQILIEVHQRSHSSSRGCTIVPLRRSAVHCEDFCVFCNLISRCALALAQGCPLPSHESSQLSAINGPCQGRSAVLVSSEDYQDHLAACASLTTGLVSRVAVAGRPLV